MSTRIKNITIVGGGLMGCGIAQILQSPMIIRLSSMINSPQKKRFEDE